MRGCPVAFGWVDPDFTDSPGWDEAQVRRLARRLGYGLVWPGRTLLPLVDQVRQAGVDAVLAPSPGHFDAITLHAVMCIADVETCCPRMSFARWSAVGAAGWPG